MISEDEVRGLAEKLRPYQFSPGEVIIREGDVGNFLLILYQGRVNVMKSKGHLKAKPKPSDRKNEGNLITSKFTAEEDDSDEANADPTAQVIAIREGPDLMGEAALQKAEKRVCDVVAHSYCKCLLLYKEDYESALANYVENQKIDNKALMK